MLFSKNRYGLKLLIESNRFVIQSLYFLTWEQIDNLQTP